MSEDKKTLEESKLQTLMTFKLKFEEPKSSKHKWKTEKPGL